MVEHDQTDIIKNVGLLVECNQQTELNSGT